MKSGRVNKTNVWVIISLFILAAVLASPIILQSREAATVEDQHFLIGVSQPNLNEPRQIVMNHEIKQEAEKEKNVRVIYTDAADSSEKQVHDVEKLMNYGIDLLIISLNDSDKLTPIVTKAYRNIPVIVLGRGVTGYDYTLFIGPDNLSIGKKTGRFALDLLTNGKKGIIEIQGPAGSSSVMDTSIGFRSYIDKDPSIQIVKTIVADWNRDKAEDELEKVLPAYPDVRLIFAHNDAMALGAYRALQRQGRTDVSILGIDGLEGENGGLDLVKKGVIQGTYTCPTGGKEAIQYAMSILHHEKGLPKKIILRSHQITLNNVGEFLEEKRILTQAKEQRKNASNKKIVFGFVQVGSESGWRNANTESIRQAAVQEDSIQLEIKNAESQQSRQIELIREFIKEKVDVIGFSPLVETGWDEVLAEAKAAGIPVIISDRKVKSDDDSLWITCIGSDFVEEGRRAAKWMVENIQNMPDKQDSSAPVGILELQGTPGSAPTNERKRGFEEVLKQHARFRIIDTELGDFTYESGKRLMKQVLDSHLPPFGVVFAHNDDMALGAIDAMEEAGMHPGKEIMVLSVDATKRALQALKAGKLNVSVECTPLLGPHLMKIVKDVAAGQEIPMTIVTEEGIFTQETALKEYAERKY